MPPFGDYDYPRYLPRSGVLPVQRLTQTVEVRVERNEPVGSLEERSSTSFIRYPVQRALSVARGDAAVARQTHRRSVETEHRHMSLVRFLNRSLDIDCVTRRG